MKRRGKYISASKLKSKNQQTPRVRQILTRAYLFAGVLKPYVFIRKIAMMVSKPYERQDLFSTKIAVSGFSTIFLVFPKVFYSFRRFYGNRSLLKSLLLNKSGRSCVFSRFEAISCFFRVRAETNVLLFLCRKGWGVNVRFIFQKDNL